jgi:fructosamine-3-kinase
MTRFSLVCNRESNPLAKGSHHNMINQQTNLELSPIQAEAALGAWLGRPVRCTQIQRLQGGMINTVLRLEFDRAPFRAVIKLNTGEASFAEEARALDTLHQQTRFPCPQVYLHDSSARLIPYAFLLLELMPGANLAAIQLSEQEYDEVDRQLAEILLELHGHTRAFYGGIDEQPGKARWYEVFLPRIEEARRQAEIERRLAAEVLEDVDHAIHLAETALQDQGTPTLIHGDIWAGNLIVNRTEDGWRLAGIVDPGVHFADVEYELAYLEVFDTRRAAFFEAYTARRPLRAGYAQRRLFYWLHTGLIHVWLFGDAYYRDFTARTAAAIREIMDFPRE